MYINGQYVDEDRFWDQYQEAHDPQYGDEDEDFSEWDAVDDEVDERILEARR